MTNAFKFKSSNTTIRRPPTTESIAHKCAIYELGPVTITFESLGDEGAQLIEEVARKLRVEYPEVFEKAQV